ncbi:ubiquitin carboxyl-terminal hydrolase 40 isoform X2 [Amia ocellicauda]|uniref:ubiquitin carboxyl-terminal hydrolase 40 isoform X2 n=1 Tax=Amia ocellicauda TaxID=2972642 RepID=UPI0034643E85
MFGNLFEEDDEAFMPESAGHDDRKLKGKDCEPPPPRGATNLCGIKNQGGTCYLNSLLQTLLFTPEFREALFNLGPEELGCVENKDKPEANVRVIPLELQKLFAHLLLLDQLAASTTDLTDSFGWSSNEEMSQQDVQELNRILFSALESSLVGTSGSDLIQRLYHGTVVNQIVCKECGNVSEKQEDFLDLTVSVNGVSGLEEALWNMYVEEELFEGNNLYCCGLCNNLVRAAKSAKLRKLPPFLTVSLLRFSFDLTKCERYKEMGRYTFPVRINLRPFCEKAERADSEYEYELFSVIIHKGGCYGGHYHVYVKDIDHLGNWEAPEEEAKPKLLNKDVKPPDSTLEREDPLSVLKAILSREESNCVLVDQLGQKLLDKIGVSWNKKFRKQYGPIGKFLQSHTDTFLLASNGTRVHLKLAGSAAPEPSQSADGEKMVDLSSPSDEHHWFDLNDSIVRPIREKDIEKQFQGKESAYMLFYRKLELQRPAEAKENPRYKVPVHLLQEIEEENGKLTQTRLEFDASSNTVEVRLHLASHYRVENGALQLCSSPQESVLQLPFDRRKTVGDFRLAVYQMQDQWEGDMALTVAKSLPAGLHLYDMLLDDSQSLYSAGVSDRSDLFVWNGREVGGVSIQTGEDWEPVLLTLLKPMEVVEDAAPGSGLCESPRGVSAGTTLGALRLALGREEALLCQEERAQGSPVSGWRVFPQDDMQKTIRELALRDGDSILILEPQALDTSQFTMNGDVVTVTTPSECRWLLVSYSPGGVAGGQEEGKTVQIPATGNMLLSEVKLKAMEELQLQDQLSEYSLRQVDRNGKLLPPARENMSIRQAGVKLTSTLFLCHGSAPGATQLFLFYTVGADPPSGPEMEIIVEETITVKECLKLMLKMSGLEGECWHLRKVDWCYEAGDAITEEATLAKLKISSGDTLVVTEGRLPPKGFLRLPVWLYPGQGVCTGQPESEINHIAEGVAELCVGILAVDAELQFVGDVEISGEASLEDLKTQVMTLPNLQDLSVPSAEYLRFWVLEGKRPTKILRGNQLHINKLKLGSGTEICVQHLLKEENLGPKELVLRVKMGVPQERLYYPEVELVWDTAKECTARALRQTIASHYCLPLDKIEVAKYFPDKYEWMAVSSWSQQISKRKKKKKNENLQGAPFHLKDGDIIGVKNLLIDSNRNFSTAKDDLGKQQLRQEAEKKKKSSANLQNSESGQEKRALGRNSRRPELSLSISVREFR